MIVVHVTNEPLDKALKRYKKKFDKIGVIKAFKAKMQYQKKSLMRRRQVLKATYKQQKFGNPDA
jgi:small subunit ribosomal protein S21